MLNHEQLRLWIVYASDATDEEGEYNHLALPITRKQKLMQMRM